MRINIKAKDKIVSALSAVNGRATARTLSTEAIAEVAQGAENELKKLGIPKALRGGCKVRYCEADLPSAYKYRAESTSMEIERGSSGWFLVRLSRVCIFPGNKTDSRLFMSDDAKRYMIETVEKRNASGYSF